VPAVVSFGILLSVKAQRWRTRRCPSRGAGPSLSREALELLLYKGIKENHERYNTVEPGKIEHNDVRETVRLRNFLMADITRVYGRRSGVWET